MGRTKKYTRTTKLIETNQIMHTKSNDDNNNNHNNHNILNYEVENNNIIDINTLKKKERMLYDVLNEFFAKCDEKEIKTVIDIINGKYKISLRFLDWFVTRYCYLYKTSIQINNPYNKEEDFNINISYKAQLKSFKKKCFDPFKRKNKFFYTFDKNNNQYLILTTLGQLNFFKWALGFGIIKYVEDNFDKINNKINYVNSFFKKNIIDNSTMSLISSDEIQSKSSSVDINLLNSSNTSNLSDSSESSNSNIEINSSSKVSKKKSINYNPIVSRNIFVEL